MDSAEVQYTVLAFLYTDTLTVGRGKYFYYVCSRLVRDGREACPDGKWVNAENLEHEVYWALRIVQPQDLDAQIQTLIDRERSPEVEIKAAHATLEDVARQRVTFQTMAARDLITLDELEVHRSPG
jgi:hypothetical protein